MKVPLTIGVIVLAAWVITLVTAWVVFPTWEVRGQFGDLFGSINSLFSGLAFAGLIYMILLQRNELALQREELRLQREEMQKSRKELAEQAKLQRYQLLATIAELRFREKQVEVSALEMESLALNAPARGDRHGKNIREISRQMEAIIKELVDEIT